MEVTTEDVLAFLAGLAIFVGFIASIITIAKHLFQKDRLRHNENMKMIDQRHKENLELIGSLSRSQPSFDASKAVPYVVRLPDHDQPSGEG